MDGRGRIARSLTAGSSGGAVAAASSFKLPALSFDRLLRIVLRPRFGRRKSVAVPLGRRLPRGLGTGLTFAFFGAVAATGLTLGGHTDAIRAELGDPHHVVARALGLGIDRVTISGIAQLAESEVLAAAGITPGASLVFLNVSDVRAQLERVPLVKSASVRKLYPNELVVTLVEREPHALWQKNGELFVIAADGAVIDAMQDARFADLPLVVGEEANRRTKDYLALLEAAGPLKNQIRAGTLVAGRRWTLKMDNGIDVRLPELGPADALARLAKLHRDQKILQKDVIAVDLRMSDRVIVRLTEEAMAARLDGLKKKPLRGKGVET
jgi:cell division protein FtsQ